VSHLPDLIDTKQENSLVNSLKVKEVGLCIKLFREKIMDIIHIGRDLVRLIQTCTKFPEFDALYKDILHQPKSLHPDFNGLSHILSVRTSRMMIQSCITTDMEEWMLFMLSNVRHGMHMRYQEWYKAEFLSFEMSDHILPFLIRFIVTNFHPDNDMLRSGLVPRWIIIAWLLKLCRSPQSLDGCRCSLLIDFFFFEPTIDRLMNLEPAILLLVHSLKHDPAVSLSILEFIIWEAERYEAMDISLKGKIRPSITAAFNECLQKKVIRSLAPVLEMVPRNSAFHKKMFDNNSPFKFFEKEFEKKEHEQPLSGHQQSLLSNLTNSGIPTSPTQSGVPARKAPPQPLNKKPPPMNLKPNNNLMEPNEIKKILEQNNEKGGGQIKSSSLRNSKEKLENTPSLKRNREEDDDNIGDDMKRNKTENRESQKSNLNNNHNNNNNNNEEGFVNNYTNSLIRVENEQTEEEIFSHWVLDAGKANKKNNGMIIDEKTDQVANQQKTIFDCFNQTNGDHLKKLQQAITEDKKIDAKSNLLSILNILGETKFISQFESDPDQYFIVIKELAAFLVENLFFELKQTKNVELLQFSFTSNLIHVALFQHLHESYESTKGRNSTNTNLLTKYQLKTDFNSTLSLIVEMHKMDNSIGFRLLAYSISQITSNKPTDKVNSTSSIANNEKLLHQHIISSITLSHKDPAVNLKFYWKFLDSQAITKNQDTYKHMFSENCQVCLEYDQKLFFAMLPHLSKYLSDYVVGNSQLIRMICQYIQPGELYSLCCNLSLVQFILIGSGENLITDILLKSLTWSSYEQFTFWRIVEAECRHDNNLILRLSTFLRNHLDPERHEEALQGIIIIFGSIPPSSDLVENILSLPVKFCFLISSILQRWAINDFSQGNSQTSSTSLSSLIGVFLDSFLKKGTTKKSAIESIVAKVEPVMRHLSIFRAYQNKMRVIINNVLTSSVCIKISAILEKYKLSGQFQDLYNFVTSLSDIHSPSSDTED